jgi:hypothetical protein
MGQKTNVDVSNKPGDSGLTLESREENTTNVGGQESVSRDMKTPQLLYKFGI